MVSHTKNIVTKFWSKLVALSHVEHLREESNLYTHHY